MNNKEAWKKFLLEKMRIGTSGEEIFNAGFNAGQAALASQAQRDDICLECGRKKAKSADDCAAGLCPKWYAIRDKEAAKDCQNASQAQQEPTLKNNEFIPDSIEGRIQAAIKCLNMHWASNDANRFDYAIEGLEKCLVDLQSPAPEGDKS